MSESPDLSGQTFVVTGANSGLELDLADLSSVRTFAEARDAGVARALWDVSEERTGVSFPLVSR